jgi:hypothetical protein
MHQRADRSSSGESSPQRLEHLPEAMPLVPVGVPDVTKEHQARPMPMAPAEQQG